MLRLGFVALGLGALLACRDGDPGPCEWPEAPVAADGSVNNGETCGYWLLTGDEQLIVAIGIAGASDACDVTMSDSLELASSPIFSDFGETGPQWTFAFRGVMATTGAEIEILCEDGTEWHAKVAVE